MSRRVLYGHKVDIKTLKALLKDWDVISALRTCGRRNLGGEGRCRCYEVDIGGSRMTKVPTELVAGARGAANIVRGAKCETAVRYSDNG